MAPRRSPWALMAGMASSTPPNCKPNAPPNMPQPSPRLTLLLSKRRFPRYPPGRAKALPLYTPPGFPVEFVGVDELHAAFLNESRTRGRVRGSLQEIRGMGWHPP